MDNGACLIIQWRFGLFKRWWCHKKCQRVQFVHRFQLSLPEKAPNYLILSLLLDCTSLGSPRTVEITPLTTPLAILVGSTHWWLACLRALELGQARTTTPSCNPKHGLLHIWHSFPIPPFLYLWLSEALVRESNRTDNFLHTSLLWLRHQR